MKASKRSIKLLRLKIRRGKSSLILAGVLLAAFGLKGILLPNHFINGGITGISLLTGQLTGLPVSIWLILFNIPFIFLGASQINKQFAVSTSIAIVLLALTRQIFKPFIFFNLGVRACFCSNLFAGEAKRIYTPITDAIAHITAAP